MGLENFPNLKRSGPGCSQGPPKGVISETHTSKWQVKTITKPGLCHRGSFPFPKTGCHTSQGLHAPESPRLPVRPSRLVTVRGAGGLCVVTLLRPSYVGELASVEGHRRVTVLTGTPHGLMTSTTACDQGQARRELGSSLTRLARGSRLSAPPSPLEPRNPLLCRDLRARGHGGDVPCSLPGVSDSARWPSGCHAATMVSACWFCTWASLRRVSLAYVPQEVLPDRPQPALHR